MSEQKSNISIAEIPLYLDKRLLAAMRDDPYPCPECGMIWPKGFASLPKMDIKTGKVTIPGCEHYQKRMAEIHCEEQWEENHTIDGEIALTLSDMEEIEKARGIGVNILDMLRTEDGRKEIREILEKIKNE